MEVLIIYKPTFIHLKLQLQMECKVLENNYSRFIFVLLLSSDQITQYLGNEIFSEPWDADEQSEMEHDEDDEDDEDENQQRGTAVIHRTHDYLVIMQKIIYMSTRTQKVIIIMWAEDIINYRYQKKKKSTYNPFNTTANQLFMLTFSV